MVLSLIHVHIALVCYEYLITLGTEVQLFWGREITGATILFCINRYIKLLYTLFSLRIYWPFTGTTPVSIRMLISDHRSQNHRRTSPKT